MGQDGVGVRHDTSRAAGGHAPVALRRRRARPAGWRLAVGTGLLGGIAIGEGSYGLAVVGATTGWVYWSVACAVGVVVAGLAAARLRRPRLVLAELGCLAGVVVALNAAYRSLG